MAMILDQPPQIIGEITPAMRREIGCSGMWVQYKAWGADTAKNIEFYRSYMLRCIEGQPVPIRIVK